MQRICLHFVLWSALLLPVGAIHGSDQTSRLKQHVVRGIEFVVDHEISQDKLDELAGNVDDVQQQINDDLGVPAIEGTVRIYLFARQRDFSHFVLQNIRSVTWPETLGRHGIFLLRDSRPYVFLVDGPSIVPSLRHEIVHVVLNGSHPDLPIWIDEGLAQCYEATDGSHWSDRAARILANDLLRRDSPTLDKLSRLSTMSQLGPREYAGCWANMRYLLNDLQTGRPALCKYLKSLRDHHDVDHTQFDVPVLERTSFIRTATVAAASAQ